MSGGLARRRWAVLTVLALGAAGVVAGVAPAQAGGAQAGPPAQVLERDMRGEPAIQALGEHLPEVAALNDMTPAEFRAALRADSMLWVSRSGRLLFVDEFVGHGHDEADIAHGSLDPATVPAGVDVLKLHSRPGAQRLIVLDFDGHDARGTAWGSSGKQVAQPYSQDGDSATFNPDEQAVIYSVWQRVAEDYAPFDVDVTTQAPDHIAYTTGDPSITRSSDTDEFFGTRVVITPTQTYSCRCGGVAYVGVYNVVKDEYGNTHDYYQPAWVFTGGVGTGAKNIAEAASHEAGHNLGLRHDGKNADNYYTGHGNWAPIMGVGYYEPITQWSKGEYSGATNQEDDVALILEYLEHSTTAADDHSGEATFVTVGGAPVHGVIENAADTDSFTMRAPSAGTMVIAARPATVSPNLDIGLKRDTLWSDLTTSALDATMSVTVITDEVVTISVHGVGFGTADTGYTDYGSVGRYTITATMGGDTTGGDDGTTEPPTTNSPPTAPDPFTATANGSDVTLVWGDTSTNEDGFRIERSYVHPKNGQTRTSTWTVPTNSQTYLDTGLSAADYTYKIQSYNAVGESSWVTATVTVAGSGGGGGGKPSKGGGSKIPIS